MRLLQSLESYQMHEMKEREKWTNKYKYIFHFVQPFSSNENYSVNHWLTKLTMQK